MAGSAISTHGRLEVTDMKPIAGNRYILRRYENHAVEKIVLKSQLYDSISKKTSIPPEFIRKVLDGFYECVRDELAKKNAVEINGFGRFTITHRQGRVMPPNKNNPHGYKQPDATYVRFIQSKPMNRAVNAWREHKTKQASIKGKPLNQAPEGYSTSTENWRQEIPPQSASRVSSRLPRTALRTDNPAPSPSSGSPSCIGVLPENKPDIVNSAASSQTIADEIATLFPEPELTPSPKP